MLYTNNVSCMDTEHYLSDYPYYTTLIDRAIDKTVKFYDNELASTSKEILDANNSEHSTALNMVRLRLKITRAHTGDEVFLNNLDSVLLYVTDEAHLNDILSRSSSLEGDYLNTTVLDMLHIGCDSDTILKMDVDDRYTWVMVHVPVTMREVEDHIHGEIKLTAKHNLELEHLPYELYDLRLLNIETIDNPMARRFVYNIQHECVPGVSIKSCTHIITAALHVRENRFDLSDIGLDDSLDIDAITPVMYVRQLWNGRNITTDTNVPAGLYRKDILTVIDLVNSGLN